MGQIEIHEECLAENGFAFLIKKKKKEKRFVPVANKKMVYIYTLPFPLLSDFRNYVCVLILGFLVSTTVWFEDLRGILNVC